MEKNRTAIHQKFQAEVTSFKFNLFMLGKLPSAWFSGVRVVSLNETKCVTKVPYKWFSQNPFKSTYFACQAMAAELATGLPSLMATYKRKPAISMLVVDMQAQYHKKATGDTYFTCEGVEKVLQTMEEVVESKEASTLSLDVVGKNKAGDLISTFQFTWSYKEKSA